MSQYRVGTVAVLQNSTLVVGSVEADWSAISIEHLFNVRGESRVYGISDVDAGARELTLTTPYIGNPNTAVEYALTTDFTPNFALPLLYPGDIATLALINQAFLLIDQRLAQSGLDGGAPLNAPYLLHGPDPLLPNYRQFQTSGALVADDNGALLSLSLLCADQEAAELGVDPVRLMTALTTAQALAAALGEPDPYDEVTGNQVLSATVAPHRGALVHTGAAAIWTLPSRIPINGRIRVDAHNLGSGSLTLTPSGLTGYGLTSLAAGASARIDWVRKMGGTERVVVA